MSDRVCRWRHPQRVPWCQTCHPIIKRGLTRESNPWEYLRMSTNATPTNRPTRWIWFQSTKSGKRIAFEFPRNGQMRSFRIGMAEAELLIATEQAENIGHHPFKPCPESCAHKAAA